MAQTQTRKAPPKQQQPAKQNAVTVIESGTDIQALPLDRALDAYAPNFAALLPPNVTVDHFKRMVITAVNTNPELAAGDRRTLFNACSKAAHDGLMPDGSDAALVLFRGTKIKNRYGQEERIDAVQYMPMVNGIKKRLWNSGFVSSISAAPIYKNDHFRFERIGTKQILEHKPAPLDVEPGDIIGAYAIIELNTGGEPLIDVMRKSEIEKSRAQSRAPNSLMWTNFYGQAACKTVLRRCSKGAPQAALLQQILDRDEEPIDPLDGRQLVEEPRPQIADYRPADQRGHYPNGAHTGGQAHDEPVDLKVNSPPPEPTLDVVDAVGEITSVPESKVAESLLALLDAAGKVADKGEARRAIETLAQNNQPTILALKSKRSAEADQVIARYHELTRELDPFGLPGTGANSGGSLGTAKAAEPTAMPADGGSPAVARQQRSVIPPLGRFSNGAPNWPEWCSGVIAAIRRANSRGDLANINGAVGPLRQNAPISIVQDIDVALDERSREL
jgi:phage RecT family recombinase